MNRKRLSYNEQFWFSNGNELRVKDCTPGYGIVTQAGERFYVVSHEDRGDTQILTTRRHGVEYTHEFDRYATLPVAPMMPDRDGTPKEVSS